MGLAIMTSMLFILCGLLSLAARALIAIWIYRDAESRGMNPLLWCLLIVFVSVIIVLIIYLFVKKPNINPKQGKGMLITGCILTAVSFVLGCIMMVILFIGIISQENNMNYDENIHMYDNYDDDGGFDQDF